MFWTRRTGHLSDDDLSAYLDGELGGARLEQARSHLAACPDCSASLETLREVQSLVSRLPAVEPSRSFVLTPSMAGIGQRRPQPAPRRQQFVFVPAVALTLLVALIGADLVTSGAGSTSNDAAETASQAMIAKDARSSGVAESANSAGGAADAPQQRAFGAQVAPQVPAPSSAPSVTTPNPTTGQAAAPPSTGSAVATPSGEQQPFLAPVAPSGPVTQSAPSASGSLGGDIPAPEPATGATSDMPTASAPPDASTANSLSIEAVPAPTTANAKDSFGDDDGTGARNSAQSGDGETDWLRIAEALAAIAFVASLAYVFGPGLIKKGH